MIYDFCTYHVIITLQIKLIYYPALDCLPCTLQSAESQRRNKEATYKLLQLLLYWPNKV